MIQTYIVQIVISILVVLLFHNVYQYVKDSCTSKKTKDVYGYQQQKYSEILNKIGEIGEIEHSYDDNFDISNLGFKAKNAEYKHAENDLLQYIQTMNS